MWTIPSEISDDIKRMAKQIGCEWIGAVPVHSQSAYEYDDCHNSVNNYVSIYGGQRVEGFYFVEGYGDIQAIKHSVWENNKLVDIMPFKDGREYNIVGLLPSLDNNALSNYYFQSLDKYNQEIEIMYYVYQLVDPRNNQPFYVGKGQGNRAKSHMLNISRNDNDRKQHKIDKIRESGLEPRIEYLAENIIDEQLAYDIERDMIKRYGRKGYDNNGILTNICVDNRPPSHKGRTYEEIYGPEEAIKQREKRANLQRAAGGWFKGHTHTEEAKQRISEKTAGKNNPRYGVKLKDTEIARKIGDANRGKKHYGRADVKLLYIDGLDKYIYSNDLREFCNENNYSLGTFRKQLELDWPHSKRGKNKGLKIRYATNDEVAEYKDKGLSL